MINKQAMLSPAVHTLGGIALGIGGGFLWDHIDAILNDKKIEHRGLLSRPAILGVLGAIPGLAHGVAQYQQTKGPEHTISKKTLLTGKPYETRGSTSDLNHWYDAFLMNSDELRETSPQFKENTKQKTSSFRINERLHIDANGNVQWD